MAVQKSRVFKSNRLNKFSLARFYNKAFYFRSVSIKSIFLSSKLVLMNMRQIKGKEAKKKK
jgi:hypothetical protein